MELSAAQIGDNEEGPAGLISQIQNRYHASHRRDLPRLCTLARKVESRHSDDPRTPHGLADLLLQIWRDLEDHMEREERVLFPSMLQNATGLDVLFKEMRHHHACHAKRLNRIALLTRGFTPPEGACPDWWALCAMAFSFVDDFEEHMQLEDDVLFPRYHRRPC
jgi:regulator of cell morphogenesis and NO signaling